MFLEFIRGSYHQSNSTFHIIQTLSNLKSAIDTVLYDTERIHSMTKIEITLLENFALNSTIKTARQNNPKKIKKPKETAETNITAQFLSQLSVICEKSMEGERLLALQKNIIEVTQYWQNNKVKLSKILSCILSHKIYQDILILLNKFQENNYPRGAANLELRKIFIHTLSEMNQIMQDQERIHFIQQIELSMFKNKGLKNIIKQLTEEPVQPPTSQVVRQVQEKKLKEINANKAKQTPSKPNNVHKAQTHFEQRIDQAQEALDSSNLNIAQDQLKQYNNEKLQEKTDSVEPNNIDKAQTHFEQRIDQAQEALDSSNLNIAQNQLEEYSNETQAKPESSTIEMARAQLERYRKRTQSSE